MIFQKPVPGNKSGSDSTSSNWALRLTGKDPGGVVDNQSPQRFRIAFLEAVDNELHRREFLKVVI